MSGRKARHIEHLGDYCLDLPGAFLRVERRFWPDDTSCLSIMKYGQRKSDGVITAWFQPQYTQVPWDLAEPFRLSLLGALAVGQSVIPGGPSCVAHLGDFPLDLPDCFLRLEREWKENGACWLWITKYGPRPSDGLVTAWHPSQFCMIPWVLAGDFAAALPAAIERGDRAVIPERAPGRRRLLTNGVA